MKPVAAIRHGHDIPLGSRIVFVCSAFQDMTSPRAHRPALSAAHALDVLEKLDEAKNSRKDGLQQEAA